MNEDRNDLRNSLRENGPAEGKKASAPSKAYHRYFEGFTEVSVPRKNGKGTKIERIYTGNYYRQDLSNSRWILLRVLYVILFVGAVSLFISGAVTPISLNTTWYTVLPEAVSVFFLFWILVAFVSYLFANKELTINDYRSSSLSLKKASLGSAASLGTAALLSLIFIVLNPSEAPMSVLFCTVKFLGGAVLVFVMYWLERKLVYLIIPSQNKVPEDGNEIS